MANSELAIPNSVLIPYFIRDSSAVGIFFNAVRMVLGERLVDSVDEGIKSPFSIDHTHFWLQSHPGRLGKINRNKGGVDRVSEDWDHMSEQFKKYSVV